MEYVIGIFAVLLALLCFKPVGKNRSRAVYLIYFTIIYNLIIKFLVGNVGLPSALNYVSDLAMIWILVEYFLQTKGRIKGIPRSMLICGGILLGLSVISYVLNRYSPLLYLWGLRINFRFILFAMMCAVFLEKKDFKILMDILFGFFLMNVLVVTYQFFGVTYHTWAKGDFMSGLFSNGLRRGGNPSLTWLCCIVCTYEILQYLNRGGRPWRMILAVVGSCYVAALAEIKMIFLLLLIIVVLAVIFGTKSRRSIGVALLSMASLYAGIQALYLLYPAFDGFFLPSAVTKYVTRGDLYPSDPELAGGEEANGINRLTAIPYVLENFLHTWSQKLFGIGLGNAEYSKFSWLTSDFYRAHGNTRYVFFSTAMVTIELGLVGMAAYCVWFLNYLRKAFFWKTQDPEEKIVKYTAVIVSLLVFPMILSNQSLKIETVAFLINGVLAFPFLMTKQEPEKPADALPKKN